jgi:uncharacterized protein
MTYRLTLQGPNGFSKIALYHPAVSSLTWEDGTDIPLPSVFPRVEREWEPFWHINHPTNPGGKSHDIRHLKLQLGLKCNYSCQYCSQAHQPHDLDGRSEDIEPFMTQLEDWFAGGTDGRGGGVKIEFWGGEPFVYWKLLKPLGRAVKARYPGAMLTIITNGSLLDDEKLAWVEELDVGVGLSHDGPAQKFRGPDPLRENANLANIQRWWRRRGPVGRMSFNCVLHRHNQSIKAVRQYIAEKLDVPPMSVEISTEEIMLPYDGGGLALSLKGDEHQRYMHTLFWELATGSGMSVQTLREKVDEFLRSIAEKRPLASLGQKCGMDRQDSIAVDLKGNVMTCQNMSALTKHGIGNVEAFDDIALTTSYHFNTRAECPKCPLVQLCKGACMFLEDKYWTAACDNAFTHNLAVLAAALYHQTRLILTKIEGAAIRRDDTQSVDVIDVGFVEAGGRFADSGSRPADAQGELAPVA